MHPLMQQAWLDCLVWAVGHTDLMTAFRQETGCTWTPGRTPLERMIDEAAGAKVAFLEAFLPWFNRTVWGEQDGKPYDRGEPERYP
jgi:hypothetical protein